MSTKRVFGSVVAVAFQIAFRAEKYANNVFLFFKNYFWYQHTKTIQKVQTELNFSKKKKKKKIWILVKSRFGRNAKRALYIYRLVRIFVTIYLSFSNYKLMIIPFDLYKKTEHCLVRRQFRRGTYKYVGIMDNIF